jgi:spore coat protein A
VPKTPRSEAVKIRRLTLDDPMVDLLDNKRWHEPISEKPVLGTTEIWELVNTIDDTHPIHLHLVRFQILERQSFEVSAWMYDNQMKYLAQPVRRIRTRRVGKIQCGRRLGM